MKISITTYFSLIVLAIFAGSCSRDPEQPGYLSSQITLFTQSALAIGQNSAASGVRVSAAFSNDITAKGICWGTNGSPTTLQNKSSGGPGSGFVTLNLTGLTPGTTYYVRGYATTANETIYGDPQQFRTLYYQLATLATMPATNITQTTAVSGGNVTTAGGGAISARGICWSSFSSPTIANSYSVDGSGSGSFISTMNNLNPGTTYYVRAYATNQAGTAYGPLVSFTTTALQRATLTGVAISGISRTSATISGSVTADGGIAITNRGICWSTGTNPTYPASAYTLNGYGTGLISATLSGLVPGTIYYLRAYATNAAGTAYGPLTSFRTL
jgi:hypothetical protein